MDYLKVIDHEHLVRDKNTGAIINTDKSVFENAKKLRNGSASIKKLQTDVEDLKNELLDIKNLLREFIRNASNT
jgi:tetrahydromethanopterin S-methyltransferase subunit B